MTTEYIILTIALYIVGLIIGHNLYKLKTPDGELVVDSSDDAKDRWLFNLTTPVMDVYQKKTITLRVIHRKITEEDKWPKEN